MLSYTSEHERTIIAEKLRGEDRGAGDVLLFRGRLGFYRARISQRLCILACAAFQGIPVRILYSDAA